MERQGRCGTGVKCRFHSPLGASEGWGECRRRAPVFTRDEDGVDRDGWPTTRDDDWCGEHEEAE